MDGKNKQQAAGYMAGVFTIVLVVLVGIVLAAVTAAADTGGSPGNVRPYKLAGIPDYGMAVRFLEVHREGFETLWYLVRFADKQNTDEYEIVDSVLGRLSPQVCGSSELAYISERDKALALVTIDLSEANARDTVVAWDFPGIPASLLALFRYKRDDSLLIFTLNESTGHTCPWQTYLTRIVDLSTLDTIVHLDGYQNPVLSPDGTEVFLQRVYDADGTRDWRFDIAIYDLLADSIIAPVESPYDVCFPFRADRLVPLYYVKVDSLGGINVWRWSVGTGEQQVSQFELPQRVSGYRLGDDKLVCHVTLQGDETPDVEEVVIDLDSINE